MANDIRGVTLEPGFIVIDSGSGPPTRFPIADVLRQPDIPTGLTHAQVAGIGLLANLMSILLRTLMDKDILDETFADQFGMDWSLNSIIYAIEQLGGTYHDPDFDQVESA